MQNRKEITEAEQKLKQAENSQLQSTQKPESKTGKILRTVLVVGFMIALVALMVMAYLRK